MKQYALGIFIVFFAVSCYSGKMMTSAHYQNIHIGQKAVDITVHYGEPYEIRKLSDDSEEYVYIEHLSTSRKGTLMREYVFVISNGSIIDKKVHEAQSHTLQFSND